MADSSTQPSHPRRSEPISKPAGLHLKKRLRLSHVWGPAQATPSLPSKRTSTALPTCVTSCSVATAATSNTSPVWTTSRLASERSTVSPNLASSRPHRQRPQLLQPFAPDSDNAIDYSNWRTTGGGDALVKSPASGDLP